MINLREEGGVWKREEGGGKSVEEGRVWKGSVSYNQFELDHV